MSITDQLIHITVRIECVLKDGSMAYGTGFNFNFCHEENDFIPAIITNKHVIEDSIEGKFTFTVSDSQVSLALGKLLALMLRILKKSGFSIKMKK